MNTGSHGADQTVGHQPGQVSQLPDSRPPMIEIIDLPADMQIRHTTTERPIGSFFLAPSLVNRLPQPDLQSGFRSAGPYTYVDLVEGATVLIGRDAQNQFRARLSNELVASGPLLERVEGTPQWRRILPGSRAGADTSQLVITRRRLPDDEPPIVPPKRRHTDDDESPVAGEETPPPEPSRSFSDSRTPQGSTIGHLPDPWKGWGIGSHNPSPDDIRVDGIQYKVVPRGTPNDPIVYIKNPTHFIYNYDVLDDILRTDLLQQPRGAIRVPPANHWEIDPTLPFQRPLTEYVATYFPELSATSLGNVAFHQFLLANGSETATGSGLTLLRQTFNDWKTGNIHPRPQLAEPLLMLPILPTSGAGTVRITELPLSVPGGPLQRLDFDPIRFQQEWLYYMNTQSAVDLKRFMASLLTRNGYAVFDPSPSNSFPALVFQRTGHDYVFFLSLHRIRGRRINQTLDLDSNSSSLRLNLQVGARAAQAVQDAHKANKVIWLRGGSQILASYPDTVFIARDGHSRL
ncbi:hypothetical protein [Pseudomonas sp. LB3P14]